MDNTVLYKTMTGIREEYLNTAESSKYIAKSFRAETARRRKTVVSLSMCLLLAAGVVFFGIRNGGLHSETEKGSAPRPEPNGTTSTVQLGYSELTADGHGLKMIQGLGTGDLAAFSEEQILNEWLIVEGTVIDTHIKKYHVVVETDGRGEQAGQRVESLREPESLITEIRVSRIWKGDGSIAVGDTIIMENELFSVEKTFCCKTGTDYVLTIGNTPDTLVYLGLSADDVLLEGDIHRETRCIYYPHQPAIEKSSSGDYIVPATWKSIALADDVDVIVTEDDLDDETSKWYRFGSNVEGSDWYQVFALKLVSKDNFEKRMRSLISVLQ